jgi:predicted O-linked N-acetylglucosamine transferase (SPINDLY family)
MSDLLEDLLQKTAITQKPLKKSPKTKAASEVSSLNALFDQMLSLFNQAEFVACEKLALKILANFPTQGAVWKVLGAIYQQNNQKTEAASALLNAVKLLPKDAEAHYNLANFYFDDEQHKNAIAHYRKATQINPNFAIAYFNLASVYKALGDKNSALECFKSAYSLEPTNIKICLSYASALTDAGEDEEAIRLLNYVKSVEPEISSVYFSLGILCEKHSKNEEALSHYQQTITLAPNNMEAYNNYALLLNRMNRVEEAEAVFKQAISKNDQISATFNNLGFLYKAQQRFKDAEYCFKKAMVLDKNSAPAYNNYALLMLETGQFKQAELFCLKSLEIKPDYDCAHINLGLVLINMNRYEEAIQHFEAAFETNPDHYMAMANLAIPLKKLNRLAVAEKYLKRAIEIKPDYFNAHLNLGSIYQAQGRMVDCIEATRKALEISPESTGAYSNLLFDLSYTEAYSTEFKVETARNYGALLTKISQNPYTSWKLQTENQRLRIGFVSGDFIEHPVSYFLRNVVANIDKNQFELFAYTTDAREDAATALLKNHLQWNSLVGLTNQEAAAKIHHDGIHILIDLSGHTAGNRLPVFALKPAPVQATWLGYWSTTGVEQMDYLIADQTSLPESIREQFTEQIEYIPDTRFCFAPPNIDIQPSALPALENGYLTLGCYQNFAKVSDEVLQLWGQVFNAIPNAQLRWQTGPFKDQEVLDATKARLLAAGFDLNRVRLIGSVTRQDYFKTYHEIDFLLDCFPFSGCTTTCEGLWMGVPTLTLPGNSLVARQGASFMTAVGLENWVAKDQQNYVEKAINFAKDLQALSQLRSQLRAQMMQSLVGDAARFAKNMEQVLRNIWSKKMQNANEAMQAQATQQVESVSENAHLDAAIQEVYALALEHQLKGEVDEAEKLYLEILNVYPRHADANHNLGYIETQKKGADAAMPRFEIALTENPHSEQFWVSFIDALHISGDIATAKAAIEQGRKMVISAENAEALIEEIDTALWQKNQKLNCFSEAIPSEIKQQKFLVVAPSYTSKSAGIVVMHTLCHDLNALGYPTALVLSDVKDVTYSNNPKYFGPNLDYYAINGEAELQQFIEEGIVIYPEIVKGNPLKAKKVVRYVLNTEGFVAKNKMNESANDFILAFSPVYHENPHALLMKLNHFSGFNDDNTLPALQRTMDMTYIGKGHRHQCKVVAGTVELSRTWPTTKDEVAILMRNTRYFYTWDYRTQTVTDALMCGAIPIYLSVAPYASLDELNPNEFAARLGTFGKFENGEMKLSIPEDYDRRRQELIDEHLSTIESYGVELNKVLALIFKHFKNLNY